MIATKGRLSIRLVQIQWDLTGTGSVLDVMSDLSRRRASAVGFCAAHTLAKNGVAETPFESRTGTEPAGPSERSRHAARFAAARLARIAAMNVWPPKPGLTVITRIFRMDDDVVGAGLGEGFEIRVAGLDHQAAVERRVRAGTQGRGHRGPKVMLGAKWPSITSR